VKTTSNTLVSSDFPLFFSFDRFFALFYPQSLFDFPARLPLAPLNNSLLLPNSPSLLPSFRCASAICLALLFDVPAPPDFRTLSRNPLELCSAIVASSVKSQPRRSSVRLNIFTRRDRCSLSGEMGDFLVSQSILPSLFHHLHEIALLFPSFSEELISAASRSLNSLRIAASHFISRGRGARIPAS